MPKEGHKPEHEHKSKKRKPRRIITTRHDDNTYSHEHQHDDGKHNLYAGTSTSLDDVKQHMEDHFGEAHESPQEEAGEAPQVEQEEQQAEAE